MLLFKKSFAESESCKIFWIRFLLKKGEAIRKRADSAILLQLVIAILRLHFWVFSGNA